MNQFQPYEAPSINAQIPRSSGDRVHVSDADAVPERSSLEDSEPEEEEKVPQFDDSEIVTPTVQGPTGGPGPNPLAPSSSGVPVQYAQIQQIREQVIAAQPNDEVPAPQRSAYVAFIDDLVGDQLRRGMTPENILKTLVRTGIAKTLYDHWLESAILSDDPNECQLPANFGDMDDSRAQEFLPS